MRFLPFISEEIFLILYALYSFILIVLVSMYIAKSDKKDNISESINEDEAFILTYSFNIKHIFYYVTHKLYSMKVLGKNNVKKRYYPCSRESVDLKPLEMEVYNLYESNNGLSPNEFKEHMVNKEIFKKFYDEISNGLNSRGFFKSNEEIKGIKNKLNMAIVLLVIPGIWRAVGEVYNKESAIAIIIEIIIIIGIAIFSFSEYRSDKLSAKGKASLLSYRKNHGFNSGSVDRRNSKVNADANESVEFNNDSSSTNNIVSGAALGYFVGMSQINDSSNNDETN